MRGSTIVSIVTRFPGMKVCSLQVLLLVMGIQGFAHNYGTVKGNVLDENTTESLPGANIIFEGTMIGTVSEIDGTFELRNIHEGKYQMIVSYIGYISVKKEVIVKKGEETYVRIEMKTEGQDMDPYVVAADRPYTSASLKYIRNIDLEIRPNKSSQDLLKLVPGLITSQHAGGGKAEQIFLRGFDADHGTDVNISVDGIPVNMVSHGHGQGYADLHFLIPETVEELDVYKGPYFSEFGNLATAGSVKFKTMDILDQNMIKIEGGQFNTFRGTMLYQMGQGGMEQNAYVAAQYYQTDGPFESPLKLQRMNVFGKYFVNLSHNSRLTLSLGSFASAWNASGQIPERTINEGIISRYGAIDDMEGGNTNRSNISIQYTQKDEENNTFDIQAYLCDYDFKLFSNFTYYLDDTINGDMIEQLDNRFLHGLNTSYKQIGWIGQTLLKTNFGSGYRGDDISIALYHSPNRIRQEVYSDAAIKERNVFAWLEEEVVFNNKLRLKLALRGDYFTFNVDDHVSEDSDLTGLPHASGYAQQGILSPKLNLAYSPIRALESYINFGYGFHSNDARSVILAQSMNEMKEQNGNGNGNLSEELTTILPRAMGAEIGFRFNSSQKVYIGIAGWYMYLEKEYVYVGDGGYAELNNPTQRMGLDFEGRLKLKSWLWVDLDVCMSEGRIMNEPDGANYIPLAIPVTLSGGLTVLDWKHFDGSLRYLYISDRPANETNSVIARGYSIFNLGLAYNWKKLSVSMTIENLLDTEWNEAQFDTESQMQWENEPVSEIHFTPGNPRNVQFGISYKF